MINNCCICNKKNLKHSFQIPISPFFTFLILILKSQLVIKRFDILTDQFSTFSHSWGNRRSSHWDLQSNGSASCLHDCWLHDVAQFVLRWNDLSISGGQSADITLNLTPPLHLLMYVWCMIDALTRSHCHIMQSRLNCFHLHTVLPLAEQLLTLELEFLITFENDVIISFSIF